MPFESHQILDRLKNVRTSVIAGKTGYRGKLSGLDLLLLNTGIGKVNAAVSAACILEKFPVKNIINLGVGGAYPGSGLRIGDIAVASKEIYGDEGVITSKGYEGIKTIGIPLLQRGGRKYFNEFPVSASLLIAPSARAHTTLPAGRRGFNFKIKSGRFVTVSAATGTRKRTEELERRFKPICENMEGAAIAQVCTIYEIPMLEIRGISNIVGIRDKRKWNLKLASENCQKAVLEAINTLQL